MRHTSAQGPSRLRRAPQLAVDPLLGHPALHLCRGTQAGHETAVAKSAEGTNRGQVRDSSSASPVEGEPSTHQGSYLKPLATQRGLRMRVWRPGSAQAMLVGRGQARKSRCGRWRGYSPAATATRTRMEVLTQVHASSQEPLTPSGSPP
eukprot:COSAG02_NODE_2358_length_9064_cov_12.658003_7_plen_149_part_00